MIIKNKEIQKIIDIKKSYNWHSVGVLGDTNINET